METFLNVGYDRVIGTDEFKYAIRIFQRANGIAMASKCKQNKPKLQ